jgi:hypothetical protein
MIFEDNESPEEMSKSMDWSLTIGHSC